MISLPEIARRRLNPPITDSSYLVLRARRLIFSAWTGQLEKRPLDILDVGGRYQPYRPLLEGRIGRYVAADLERTELVTVVADGQALPFAAESFDLVIATQVFDCFPDPHLAAREMCTVLRPGGQLWCSIPAFAPQFDQGERWRFTSGGIRSLMAPFAKVELVAEVDSIGGLLRSANLGAEYVLRYPGARVAYRYTLGALVNLLGVGVERMRLTSDESFTANYSVRAVKN
jgi:SAM-dependent methyltransferase